MNRLEDQTLALAAMFQAAIMVDQLATTGNCNSVAFDCSFDSLFSFDVETTVEVFGDISSLESGFEALAGYLGGEIKNSSKNIAYYVFSTMKIAPTLVNKPLLANKVLYQLQNIETGAREFNMSRSNVIMKVDQLYQENISYLNPRIMVRGNPDYLQENNNAGKIRTLLLAGIRAAVLWHQLGGSKWRLFWGRKQFVAAAREFLNQG